ncbi:cytochrome P450 71A3-like [Dioscorea cayenensis subsp. rotundata]|uniref:Cytochrome P450 71A3-like n=1 Tax=Dioscorea cayennensis subsp. rotundata TaxID=55577 RepID=A0AB40CGR7_DIOCR|nr:cytochrome P450 71A3-like [Dioscorea cayenensis subsp. rotundata]
MWRTTSLHLDGCVHCLDWMRGLRGLEACGTYSVLDQMIEEHVNRNKKGERKDDDFMDILLSIQSNPNKEFYFSKNHVKALLLDMLFGGTETRYVALEWSFAELIRNPKVMKKLQDEVGGKAFGKSMVKEKDLSGMNYLKAFLKEILRLHPPGIIIST